MESSGTWVISRSGRGFLVEDSRAGRGGRLGELGVSGGRKWDTVEAWGHQRGINPRGEKFERGGCKKWREQVCLLRRSGILGYRK